MRAIEADVAMSEETAHEVVRDEGIDARGGRILDEFAEALDGERGGAALVDDAVTPERMPTSSGFIPKSPVTCW